MTYHITHPDNTHYTRGLVIWHLWQKYLFIVFCYLAGTGVTAYNTLASEKNEAFWPSKKVGSAGSKSNWIRRIIDMDPIAILFMAAALLLVLAAAVIPAIQQRKNDSSS